MNAICFVCCFLLRALEVVVILHFAMYASILDCSIDLFDLFNWKIYNSEN